MATKKIAAFINKIVEKFNFNKISYRAYFPVYAGYQIQAHSWTDDILHSEKETNLITS